jgi:hypothetical protein
MPPQRALACFPRSRHVSHACPPLWAGAVSIVHVTEGLLNTVCDTVFRSWPAVNYKVEILAASDPDSGIETKTFPCE